MKKLRSQAQKYDRELADYNRRKQLELGNSILEGFGAKSLPFSGQSRRKKFMKRKKRKRVEDTVDIASYMSHHNLFSYYGTDFHHLYFLIPDSCKKLFLGQF